MRRRSYRRPHPQAQTVKDGVTTAFKALRKAGYITRQNFLCCGSCASYAIGQQEEKAGRDRAKSKAVYFSRQGEERLWSDGRVHINWSGNGSEIVAALQAAGLATEWNGTETNSILATFPTQPNMIEQ